MKSRADSTVDELLQAPRSRRAVYYATLSFLALATVGMLTVLRSPRRIAVEKIVAIGGTIEKHSPIPDRAEPLHWQFLKKTIGPKYFYKWFAHFFAIDSVSIWGVDGLDSQQLNELLLALRHIPELRSLSLTQQDFDPPSSIRISAQCFRYIGELSNLETLDLSGLPVTDSHLQHLSALPRLQTLFLAHTNVRGKAFMRRWKSAATLDELELSDSQFTARYVSALEQFTNLKYLDLGVEDFYGETPAAELSEVRQCIRRLQSRPDLTIEW